MGSEEKIIHNMRRRKMLLVGLLFMIALFTAAEAYAIYAINHMHHGLERLNQDLYLQRSPQYELLLAQILEGQSRTELSISKTYTIALTQAVVLGVLIGFFLYYWQQSRLTVAMWDRIKHLEEELLRIKERDYGTGAVSEAADD